MRWSLGVLVCTMVAFLSGAVLAGPVDEQMSKARRLYDQGKFLEAAEMYKKILSENKDQLKESSNKAAEVWQAFGEALLRAGRKAEADKAFSRVAAHRGRKIDQLNTLQENPKAPVSDVPSAPPVDISKIEDLKSTKDPEVQELYKNAMGFAAQGGSKIMAIVNLMEACRKEPENPDLLAQAGLLILDNAETYYREAREYFEKLNAVKKGILSEAEAIGFARILFLMEPFRFDEAETLLNGVLKNNPKSISALVTLAELNQFRGKNDIALTGFQKVKELDPKEMRAWWGMGYALKNLERVQESRLAFRDAYDRSSQDAPANVKMGKAMIFMGKENFASDYFGQALAIDPDNIDANLGLIPILLKLDEDMTARQYLDKVGQLDPGHPKFFFYRGIWKEMRGEIGPAVRDFELSAAYGPETVEAKLRLAKIFMGVGHSFPGKSFSNEHPMVRKELNLYKNYRKALQFLKEVMLVAPGHPEISFVAQGIDSLEKKLSLR